MCLMCLQGFPQIHTSLPVTMSSKTGDWGKVPLLSPPAYGEREKCPKGHETGVRSFSDGGMTENVDGYIPNRRCILCGAYWRQLEP